MAALLSAFHPVPVIIRKRAKELLDVIRDAVKGALASKQTETTDEASVEQNAMVVDENKVPEGASDAPTSLVQATLWSSSMSLWFHLRPPRPNGSYLQSLP